MIEVVSNGTAGTMLEQHILEIPPCCPVSKNPRPGSKLTISYQPCGCSLEIGSLLAYIHSFRGSLRGGSGGDLVVRDMEGMIYKVAEECARVLQLEVTVEAHLLLLPKQEMKLTIVGEPNKIMTSRQEAM